MKKFVFLHIPKTAGVSIYHSLKEHLYDIQKSRDIPIKADDKRNLFYGHVPTWQMIKEGVIEPGYFDDTLIFHCVRNVWDRFASLYYYLDVGNQGLRGGSGKSMTMMEYAEAVKSAPKNRHCLGHPQSYWLRGLEGKTIPLFMGDYGMDLEYDFKVMCDMVGIERRPLQRRNLNENYSWSKEDIYSRNPGLQEIVAEIYAEDIQRFGQSFPY